MTDTEALKALVALGKRMRDTEKAAADAWNQPTDAEHDRLSLEADHLFEDFGHAAEAALPSLERMLASQMGEPVAWAVTYMGEIVNVSVYFRKEDAEIDLNNRNIRMPEYAKERGIIPLYAAPAAGMDADSAAREILETYTCKDYPHRHEVSQEQEIAAIIRRHMQQGK